MYLQPWSLDHDLGLHLNIQSLKVSKCIAKYARLPPPCASPNFFDHSLQVYLQTRSMMGSKFARSWLSMLSPNSLNHHLLSASLSSLDHGLQVYLQICSITTSKCISKLAQSRPWSVSLSYLNCHFQVHIKLLSNITSSQFRYTVCRLVAI